MNSFDIVVILGSLSAIAAGFRAGLLRSTATILAHLIAVPRAVFLVSRPRKRASHPCRRASWPMSIA